MSVHGNIPVLNMLNVLNVPDDATRVTKFEK